MGAIINNIYFSKFFGVNSYLCQEKFVILQPKLGALALK